MRHLALAPDGRRLAVATGAAVYPVDVATGRVGPAEPRSAITGEQLATPLWTGFARDGRVRTFTEVEDSIMSRSLQFRDGARTWSVPVLMPPSAAQLAPSSLRAAPRTVSRTATSGISAGLLVQPEDAALAEENDRRAYVIAVAVGSEAVAEELFSRLADRAPLTITAELLETPEAPAAEPEQEGLCGLIGRSAPMRELHVKIRRACGRDTPVLVVGESGSGKALVARAIHELSPRRHGPPLNVNVAALPETATHSWPENVRELRNLLETLAIETDPATVVTAQRVRSLLSGAGGAPDDRDGGSQTIESLYEQALRAGVPPLEQLERALAEVALARSGGSHARAARSLGVHRNTLRRKLTSSRPPPPCGRRPRGGA